MTGILLGLAGAVFIGLGNFVGGVASRKNSSLTVSVTGLVASLPFVLLLPFLFPPDEVTVTDVIAGVAAGVLQLFAVRTIWRAMATGAMGLLSALNAMLQVVIPVLWVAVTVGSPGSNVFVGTVLACIAVLLVAFSPGDAEKVSGHRRSVIEALVAGTLFGIAYVCLDVPSHESTVVPLVAMRVTGIVAGVALMLSIKSEFVLVKGNRLVGLAPGLLGTAGLFTFVGAVHLDVVAVTSVVQGLAPIVTTILAFVLLKQRLRQIQSLGFALAVGATVLLAV